MNLPPTIEQAEIDRLTKERDELKAKIERIQSHVRCMYCNTEYAYADKDNLADHILSCEKSPLVQAVKEMDSIIIDRMDMVSDEFCRILAITDDNEIIGICERAQQVIEQKEPVIKQRDDAIKDRDTLRARAERLRKCLLKSIDALDEESKAADEFTDGPRSAWFQIRAEGRQALEEIAQ